MISCYYGAGEEHPGAGEIHQTSDLIPDPALPVALPMASRALLVLLMALRLLSVLKLALRLLPNHLKALRVFRR